MFWEVKRFTEFLDGLNVLFWLFCQRTIPRRSMYRYFYCAGKNIEQRTYPCLKATFNESCDRE